MVDGSEWKGKTNITPYDPRIYIKLMFYTISFLYYYVHICLLMRMIYDLSKEIYPVEDVKVSRSIRED